MFKKTGRSTENNRSNIKPQKGFTRRQSQMKMTYENFERGGANIKRQSTALVSKYALGANYESAT